MTITITKNLILDENFDPTRIDDDANVSAGSDNDVASLTISSSLESQLTTALNGQTTFPTGFPQYAERTDMLAVGGTITDYALTLPGSTTAGFTTTSGKAITLSLSGDGNIVFGTDSDGHLAFAVVLDETKDTSGHVTAVNVWTIEYQPLMHASGSAIDDGDTLDLSGLINIQSTFDTTQTVEFNDFSSVPSGQDVWTAIEPTSSGVADPDILVTAFTRTTTSETQANVNVSTTGLGANSQAVDPQEGIRVDFVNHARENLTNTDVHDASKLSYTDHSSGTTAGFSLTQVNPTGKAVNLNIAAFDTADTGALANLQGQTFLDDANQQLGETVRNIAAVQIYNVVFNADGSIKSKTLLLDTSNATPISTDHYAANGVTVDLTGTSAALTGIKVNYQIDFQSSGGPLDRFEVYNSDSKGNLQFDVGRIHLSVTTGGVGNDTGEFGSHLIFEDDGPTLAATGTAPAALMVDESNLPGGSNYNPMMPPSTSQTGDFSSLFVPSYGADGPAAGDALKSFALGLGGAGTNVDSGLIDSASGGHVVMNLDASGNVIGTAGLDNHQVFSISVDSGSGMVTLTQFAAVHEGTSDTASSTSLAASAVADTNEASVAIGASLITLSAKAYDGDGDVSAAASANIGDKFQFLDDGPQIGIVPSGSTTLNNVASNVQGASATGTFTAPDGADGATVSITDAADLTSIGLYGVYNANHTNIIYYDTTDPTLQTLQSGHAVYEMQLTNDTTWQFDVLKTQTSPPENLLFSAIKSGSPVEFLDVHTDKGHTVHFDGLYWGSANITGTQNLADLQSGDLDNPDQPDLHPADDLNPDSLGFGVKNGQASQMNQNEGFFFNALAADGTPLQTQSLNFDVVQIGSVKAVTVEEWLYKGSTLIDYNTQSVALSKTNQTVYVADNGATATLPDANSLGQSFDTAYVRFTYANGDTNAGVRIINFQTHIATQLNDRDLPFQVTNTDADTDTAVSNTFHVTVDNPNSTTVDHYSLLV